MGVIPSDADTIPPPSDLDLVAAYAANALDADEALLVDALLASDAAASNAEQLMRLAASAYAEILVDDVDPPAPLRTRTLAAALETRPGHPTLAASAAATFQVESERFAATLRRLAPDDWAKPVDPPEFVGWTIHDLAAHVTASQSLFAQLLGAADPAVPETDNSNDARTAVVQARHRAAGPGITIEEYERASRLAAAQVDSRPDDDLTDEIEWWGTSMQVATVLLHRSFETWTHHDDVRRAVGLPQLPPPASSLAAMSTQATEWTAVFLSAADANVEGEIAVIDLTGPGGGRHVVDLGHEPLDPAVRATAEPRFTLHMDVVDYCRSLGNRVPPGGYPYQAEGDTDLATTLVGALPALSGL